MDNRNNFVDSNKGVISGDVTDDDGMPLQGVTVKLLDANDVVIATTTTDSDGDYEFMGLFAGTYTVKETNPADHSTNISDEDKSPDGDAADNNTGTTVDDSLV